MPPNRACGPAVRNWKRQLIEAFKIHGREEKEVVEIPRDFLPVCRSPNELSSDRKLELRTIVETFNGTSTVKLYQFDPNFFSYGRFVSCRIPGCESQKPKQIKMPEAEPIKEDLYLCPHHRENLQESITEMYTTEIDIVTTNGSEDIQGYTSIIGLLERARKPYSFDIEQEVCLNLRNFLIIVNALLNPDDENIIVALNPTMAIFTQICQAIRCLDTETLKQLVDLLDAVIQQILFAFGVIYSWVHLSLISNYGSFVGAGVGGLFGLAGYFGGPAVGTAATVGGAVFGSLLGRGIFKVLNPQQSVDREIFRRYQTFVQAHMRGQREAGRENPEPIGLHAYYLLGSEFGDLDLAVINFQYIVNPWI